MNVQTTVNYCLSLPYFSLKLYARKYYKKVFDYLENLKGKEKAEILVNGCIFTCIALDGKLNVNESKFICEIIDGYTKEKVFELANEFYNKEAQDVTKNLIEVLPNEIKSALLHVCIAVLSVDKRVSDKEINFLNSL